MSEPAVRRRNFFRSLAREAVVRADDARGVPQLRLDQLDQAPENVLERLIPAVIPGVEILPEEEIVRARVPGLEAPVALFRPARPELFVFNRFNGRNSLGQVAAEWALETQTEYGRAFGFTRALFLRLSRLGVCAPVNTA